MILLISGIYSWYNFRLHIVTHIKIEKKIFFIESAGVNIMNIKGPK